ncbi:hypothetical protein AO265_31335 [Pseudomonas sp. ABAC61]|nr:hypothetical protein AO265_31335 [Pseudomonas sp. ABAC61]
MQRDALLTQDELDFIRTLQHNPHLNVRDTTSSLLVNGGSQLRDLLTRLAANEKVGVPSIFEDGPMVRPWRLALQEPVALENAKGHPGRLWVREVSFKGVLLEIRNKTRPPRQFAQWFSPSGYERIALRGQFERETEAGFYAYRLDQDDAEETERLRQFILQQHRHSHPAVHA